MITQSPVCRIPQKKSLFEGYIGYMPSPASNVDNLQTYYQCLDDGSPSFLNTATPVFGSPAVSDMSTSEWEPNLLVVPTDQSLFRTDSEQHVAEIRIDNFDSTYEYVHLNK